VQHFGPVLLQPADYGGLFFLLSSLWVIPECIRWQQYTAAASGVLGVLNGLNLAGGATCSPVSIIGVAGDSCTQQPVCCSNNNFVSVAPRAGSPLNLY